MTGQACVACVHLERAGGGEYTARGPVSIVMGSEAGAHLCGVAPHTAHIMEESGGSKGKGGYTISRNLDCAHRRGGVHGYQFAPSWQLRQE